MSKIPEFKEYLRMHLSFLVNSAAAFDRGEMDEAIRMAVSIRVLFHDTGRSTSLLMQLGAKDIFLTSTCAPIPEGAFVGHGSMVFTSITMTANGPVAAMKASLGDGPPVNYHLKAEDWWNQTVFVLPRGEDRRISRKDIVLVAANKDGGAHVDTELTPQYESLKERGGTLWSVAYSIQTGLTSSGSTNRPSSRSSLNRSRLAFASIRAVRALCHLASVSVSAGSPFTPARARKCLM
jgi:hypothetical protein